jgi:hypothetical protein
MTAERLRRNRRRRRGAPGQARARARRIALAALLVALGIGAGLAATRIVPSLARDRLPSLESWLRGERWRLRHVDVLGLRTLDGPALVRSIGLAEGTPLVDLDVDAVLARLAEHPRVARASGVRIPPDRLLLSVEERVPIALLAPGADGIDAGGARFPLAPGEAEGLPQLSGDSARALPLLVAARERGLALASVSAARPGDVRFRPADLEVDVRVGNDPERALSDWQRVARTGLVRGYGAGEVDLRFANGAVLRSFADREHDAGPQAPGARSEGVRDRAKP